MLRERRLIKFLKQNDKEFNALMKKQLGLFDKLGKQYDDTSLQIGFTGVVIGMYLKSSNMPKKVKVQLLKNIVKQVKNE